MEERYDRAKGKGGGRTDGNNIGKEIDGKLYFTEEQVIACLTSHLNINADGSTARGKAPSGPSKCHGGRGHSKECSKEARSTNTKNGIGGEIAAAACHYCGKSRH
ncbi:unnamed protein product [Miscanthus lutarioriparius]|uniref:Uncharacterized protein n=1 Tax=Miscanthus lutarioriparius TaxID=422564 RepID=A0A811RMB2_9POAL|nr:unnamed protein product [Miscanthus lutarioriparius]